MVPYTLNPVLAMTGEATPKSCSIILKNPPGGIGQGGARTECKYLKSITVRLPKISRPALGLKRGTATLPLITRASNPFETMQALARRRYLSQVNPTSALISYMTMAEYRIVQRHGSVLPQSLEMLGLDPINPWYYATC